MPQTRDDLELTREQVQSLSTAEAVASLFAYLGYPGDTRLPMTAEALGLNADLTRAARRIERLASVEAGALEIYLFELKSVTVGHTRALARTFRDRAGNYLLALTDDYDRLDFVLLERALPEQSGNGISRKGISLRPRVLTVDRRNPNPVALRVLRRFTLTEYDADGEPDPYAQYDKLQSAYVVAEWSEPLFNNRALFSDYYLNERLPGLPEWNDPARNQAFRAIRDHFAGARRRFSGQDSAALRRQLIQPLLETLGFQVETVEENGDSPTPDFRLTIPNSPFTIHHSPFVLAYPWSRYLDGKDESRDSDRPEENPGAQAVSLLEAGEAPWAIVTNGKIWRLYSTRAHSRATNYYEIDLEETLASPAPAEAFRYFYLFFRAEAFAPAERMVGGESRSLGFLDWLMEESANYARELGERLKERVFEDIFPHFAAGFIEGLGGSKTLLAKTEAEREAILDDVFHGTLTFLYRLLFLLYAESRDLLPAREARGYHQISLQRLKEEIAAKAKTLEDQAPTRLKKAYAANESTLYDRLLALFEVIDNGDASRNVPVYNGGLFMTDPPAPSPSEGEGWGGGTEIRTARFLQQTKIPDRHLALGLDRLARDIDPKRGDLVFIDYKSLGVRQLGSIYEGLLEFKVRLAAGPMAVVKGKKSEEIVPVSELPGSSKTSGKLKTLPAGAVYLENDRRERKATGSYYTPDYIVKYIVQHTVGPVLDEKFQALRPRLEQAASRFYKAVRQKQSMANVSPDKPALLTDIAAGPLRDLFDIKVLDPAMGSGHFLVEAVDYITDRLVRFVEGFPFLSHFFDGMRRDILAEMERQNVTIDPGRLTDVTLLKRHVLKRCIYGVDLNPMAVELAKVSLWLDCFTLGAPLSFLDHHLRHGNSLIGASARQAEAEMGGPGVEGQMTFLTGPFVGLLRAAEIMRGISLLTDVTMTEVRESEQLFREFDRAAKPYKQLLDVYVARHFDVKRADEFLRLYGVEAITAQAGKLSQPYQTVLAEARRLYEEKAFFHWDLEFPEVFIDLDRADWKADGGFDAVVGNPPWVDVQEIEQSIKIFLRSIYKSARGKNDIYPLFVEKGISLLSNIGIFAMIIQSKFLFTDYGLGLRSFLAEQANISKMVYFSDASIFGPITVYPFILVASKKDEQSGLIVPVVKFEPKTKPQIIEEVLGNEELQKKYTLILSHKRFRTEDAWQITLPDFVSESSRIFKVSNLFADVCESIAYGSKTNLDTVYLSDIGTWTRLGVELELLRPAIKPRDFDRYEFIDTNQFIIFPYTDSDDDLLLIDLARFPGAKGYFEEHKQELAKRRFYGQTVVERGMKFYELPYVSSYSRKPKLAFPTITDRATFVFDPTGEKLFIAPCYVVHLKDYINQYFVIAVLNSRFTDLIIRARSTELASGYMEMQRQYVEGLPIRRIHFTTPAAERQQKLARLVSLYGQGQAEALLAQVEQLLPKDEAGNFLAFAPNATGAEEQSDVVHDLLAHLAQQMIDLNRQKQAEQKRYFESLEAALRISPDKSGRSGIDALSGKTYIWGYLGDYQKGEPETEWAVIEETLFKNKGRIGANLSDNRLIARLRSEFEQSLAALRPLKAELARTDWLIDQIVYRLYGLTEEEIAVVEGK